MIYVKLMTCYYHIMMAAEFSIDIDVKNSLAVIVMGGFFNRDDITRLTKARDEAYALLRCGPHEHLTLVDMRKMDIQAQGSVTAFQMVLANPRYRSKRLAFVVAQSLARLQAKRAVNAREACFFTNIEEAKTWLLTAE